jgi:predicted AAA+ superfamily ATPase
MYIKRFLEPTILNTAESFKILYVGGPRQVGKTTLLQKMALSRGMQWVSLDDPETRRIAKQDPFLFLQQYPPPVFIDEVQYAPQLFPYLKMRVDSQDRNGLYWLSGSQHFSMIRALQESLAGRVGVVYIVGKTF